MNRAAVIAQLKAAEETIAKLVALLESSAADKFVAHLYQARKQYRLVCERPNNGNKAIEREVIASFKVAQRLGFMGDFRAWEHLVRIHECYGAPLISMILRSGSSRKGWGKPAGPSRRAITRIGSSSTASSLKPLAISVASAPSKSSVRKEKWVSAPSTLPVRKDPERGTDKCTCKAPQAKRHRS